MKLKNFIIAAGLLLAFHNAGFGQCSGFSVSISQNKTTICEGDTLYLTATPSHQNVTVDWLLPDNSVIYSSPQIGTNYAVPSSMNGRYIAYSYNSSCSTSDTFYLNIRPAPAFPTVTDNTPICEGDTLKITINSNLNQNLGYILADGSNTTVLSNTKTTAFPNATSFTHATTYIGYIIDTAGCGSGAYHQVNSIQTKPLKPTISANKNPLCAGDNLTLSAPNMPWKQFVWTDPSMQNHYNLTLNVTNTAVPGKYNYLLQEDNFGCLSDADTEVVEILQNISPQVNVNVSPNNKVGPHTLVTFSANVLDGGPNATYQWVLNGVNIPGATSSSLSLVAGADFVSGDKISLNFAANNICASPSTITTSATTMFIDLGVGDIGGNGTISLYPNPVKDILIIQGLAQDEHISLTDITGKNIFIADKISKNKDVITINAAELPAGMYVIRIGDYTTRFTKAGK